MNHFKKFIALFLTIVFAICFTACGKENAKVIAVNSNIPTSLSGNSQDTIKSILESNNKKFVKNSNKYKKKLENKSSSKSPKLSDYNFEIKIETTEPTEPFSKNNHYPLDSSNYKYGYGSPHTGNDDTDDDDTDDNNKPNISLEYTELCKFITTNGIKTQDNDGADIYILETERKNANNTKDTLSLVYYEGACFLVGLTSDNSDVVQKVVEMSIPQFKNNATLNLDFSPNSDDPKTYADFNYSCDKYTRTSFIKLNFYDNNLTKEKKDIYTLYTKAMCNDLLDYMNATLASKSSSLTSKSLGYVNYLIK